MGIPGPDWKPEPRMMPLRIPSCWYTVTNHFLELPDLELLTPGDRVLFLSEDLLCLLSGSFTGDGWSVTGDLIVDLGWYGSSHGEDGRYRLCVLRKDWDDVVISIESRDQYVIRDAIDRILGELARGIPLDDVAASLNRG